MRFHPLPLIVLLCLLPIGCKREAPPASPEGSGGAAAPPEPPPPPPPVEAPFEAVAVDAAGTRHPLDAEGETPIPSDVHFELSSPIAFRTLRVRILDARDRLVPSDDVISIGQGTRVRIEPTAALEENGTYQLRIDAPTGIGPVDIEGREYLPRTIRFSVLAPEEGGGGAGSR